MKAGFLSIFSFFGRKAELSFFPKWSGWIFTGLFLILCLLYEYPAIYNMRPQGPHAWRQSDCLSFTLNYYQEDRPFLDPGVHYLGNDDTGRGVSEFPILYYGIAKLWKVTGVNEGLFRLLTLLFVFLGLLGTVKSLEWILGDSILAILSSLLVFGSPFLIFYGFTFIADPAGLGLALIGLYFFVQCLKTEKAFWFILFLLVFILTGLIKISAALGYFSVMGLLGFAAIGWIELRGRWKKKHAWLALGLMLLPLVIWQQWYSWSAHFNEQHNSGLFLVGMLPIWEADRERIMEVLDAIWVMWRGQYFSGIIQISTILMLVLSVFWAKKIPPAIRTFSFFCGSGFVAFLLFFFKELHVHDYHLLNLLVFVPALLLSFFGAVRVQWPGLYASRGFRLMFLLLVTAGCYHGKREHHSRYHDWWNGQYLTVTHEFDKITPWLRAHGLSREDTVLSVPDPSLNITLYLMDQKGWTDFSPVNTTEKMENLVSRGVKYLVCSDTNACRRPAFAPFLGEKLGQFGNVELYRVHPRVDSVSSPPIP